MKRIANRDGRYTSYGFSQGAVESKGIGDNCVRMFMDQGVLYVRGFQNGLRFSEECATVKEARRIYDACKADEIFEPKENGPYRMIGSAFGPGTSPRWAS